MSFDPTGSPEPGRLPLPPGLSPRGRHSDRAPRSGRVRATRWVSWIAVVSSVLVLGLSGAALAYYRHLDGNITRENVFHFVGKRPAKAYDGAENILVVGDDSRVGETAAQLAAESTTSNGGGNNTDTIIILHLAPNDGPATLVSIPRDSYVPIPGHGTFKINSAFADGEGDKKGTGPGLLTQTVENLTGLHIDHFVSVGLFQFINISNAIGGVKVCVVSKILGPPGYVGGAYDRNSGTKLTQGVHTISGSQALSFVRQRDGLPDGDIDRIHRQQRFITAVVAKAKGERNPATINAILEKVTQSLTVDSGLSLIDLGNLANRLKNLKPADIRFATVPVGNIGARDYTRGSSVSPYVSYVQLNLPRLQTFFANIRAERDPNAPAAPTPTLAVTAAAPSAVRVTVLNGSGVTGGAGRARTALAGFGFGVTGIGDAASTTTTKVLYGPSDAGAAKELGLAVPSAALVPDSALATGTVQLILGSNFAGVQNPATAVTPTPAPTTPTPTAPVPGSPATAPGTTTADGLQTGKTEDGVPCGA